MPPRSTTRNNPEVFDEHEVSHRLSTQGSIGYRQSSRDKVERPRIVSFKEIEGAGGKLLEAESTDPQVAADWLRAMKYAFGYLQPTPERKLMYSVFMLRGATKDWWDSLVELDQDPTTTKTDCYNILICR
ncbi:hypothetical protein LINGRAHAP2_LOCUS30893 [Linum grandiflorum]